MKSMKVRTGTTQVLGEILSDVVEIASAEDVHRFQKVIEEWSFLVGDRLAGETRPISLKDGTLTVETAHSEIADTIGPLKSVFARYGVKAITFQLHQQKQSVDPICGSVSSSATKRAAAIQDKPLRNAMAELISAYEKSRNHS